MPALVYPDLRDFYDPSLVLPVGGKEYRIPAPSHAQTRAVREVIAGQVVSGDEYLNRIMSLLGATRGDDGLFTGGLYDEATADGVCWLELVRVAETAALHYGDNPERGRAWWAAELHAEAVMKSAAEALEATPTPTPTAKSKPRKAPARTKKSG